MLRLDSEILGGNGGGMRNRVSRRLQIVHRGAQLHLRLSIKRSQFFINLKISLIFQMHTLMLIPVTSSVVDGKNASANSDTDFASNRKYAIDVVNVCVRNRKVDTIFQFNQWFRFCFLPGWHMPVDLYDSRIDLNNFIFCLFFQKRRRLYRWWWQWGWGRQ